jgi:hypothetical protein
VIPRDIRRKSCCQRLLSCCNPAARGHPDQREVPRRAPGAFGRQPQAHFQQRRAGRSAGRTRIDYTGDALDIGFNVTYLLDVLNNVAGERSSLRVLATATAARSSRCRQRRVQVRRDADAHLSASQPRPPGLRRAFCHFHIDGPARYARFTGTHHV